MNQGNRLGFLNQVMKDYFVYIMTNKSRALYTGVTSDLKNRVYQHKHEQDSIFNSKYKINQLVYYEPFANVLDAIAREKQIKGWSREKKLILIKNSSSQQL